MIKEMLPFLEKLLDKGSLLHEEDWHYKVQGEKVNLC
jgi:hypothetical protein